MTSNITISPRTAAEEYLKKVVNNTTPQPYEMTEAVIGCMVEFAKNYHAGKLKELLPSEEEIEKLAEAELQIDSHHCDNTEQSEFTGWCNGANFIINKITGK